MMDDLLHVDRAQPDPKLVAALERINKARAASRKKAVVERITRARQIIEQARSRPRSIIGRASRPGKT